MKKGEECARSLSAQHSINRERKSVKYYSDWLWSGIGVVIVGYHMQHPDFGLDGFMAIALSLIRKHTH